MNVVSALALSLVLAFLAGKLAARLHVPQVTGYVLAGFVLGPSVLNWLSVPVQAQVHFIADLALGLILFNIGGKFDRHLLRQLRLRTLRFSVLTAAGVGLVTFIVTALCAPWTSALGWREALMASAYLGLIAMAAAPPTTLLVIKEYDSQGPVTRQIIVFLALGTVLAIAGTKCLQVAYEALGWWPGARHGWAASVALALWSIGGAVLIGGLLGLLLTYWEQHEHQEGELVFGVSCVILLGLLLAERLHLESMLVSLTLGFVLVNGSAYGHEIHNAVKNLGLSMYTLFFVLAGAHIELERQMVAVGSLTLAYLAARTTAFLLAPRLAARLTGESRETARLAGPGLLSHAGAALGMVVPLQLIATDSAQAVVEVIFAAIVVFEIIGPILLRWSLVQAGEIKIAALMGKLTTGGKQTLWDLFVYFLASLGLGPRPHAASTESLGPLIRHKILAVASDSTLDKVIRFIAGHHYPIYPVVNPDNQLLGTIGLEEVKNVMFDPWFSQLVLAEELVVHREAVTTADTPETAHEKLAASGREALPVISAQSRQYLGIILQKDLLVLRNQP